MYSHKLKSEHLFLISSLINNEVTSINLGMMPQTKWLEIIEAIKINAEKNSPSLEEIVLDGWCDQSFVEERFILLDIFNQNIAIKKLTIQNTVLEEKHIKALCTLIESAPNLQTLSFGNATSANQKGVSALLIALHQNFSLKEFTFPMINLNTEHESLLASLITHHRALEQIDLSKTTLQDQDLTIIAAALSSTQTLRTINFGYGISEQGDYALIKGLRLNTSIWCLTTITSPNQGPIWKVIEILLARNRSLDNYLSTFNIIRICQKLHQRQQHFLKENERMIVMVPSLQQIAFAAVLSILGNEDITHPENADEQVKLKDLASLLPAEMTTSPTFHSPLLNQIINSLPTDMSQSIYQSMRTHQNKAIWRLSLFASPPESTEDLPSQTEIIFQLSASS